MRKRAKLLWIISILLLTIAFSFRFWQIRTEVTLSVQQSFNHLLSDVMPAALPKSHRPDFQTGVVFPQWGQNAYGSDDTNWSNGLQQIQQTYAHWISITIPLYMTSAYSTQVEVRNNTPTPSSLSQGIAKAHADGFHVLIEPLITLDGPHAWDGYITFSSQINASQWFNSYAQILAPYLAIAQQQKAEEFSIGNEMDYLDVEFPDLWHQLLSTAHNQFSGSLIYSLNWASIEKPKLPTWLDDPNLTYVGISCYFPVTNTPQNLSDAQAIIDWKQNVQAKLDSYAQQIGKPLILTEIGYMNTHYAGYQPWQTDSSGSDDDEQATLYNAALQNISTDQYIVGTFWWAWGMQYYNPFEKPAEQTLAKWYLYI